MIRSGNFSQYFQCHNLDHFILNIVVSVLICFFSVLHFFRIGLSSSLRKYNSVKLKSLPSPSPQSGSDCLAKKLIFDRIFKRTSWLLHFFSAYDSEICSPMFLHCCGVMQMHWWALCELQISYACQNLSFFLQHCSSFYIQQIWMLFLHFWLISNSVQQVLMHVKQNTASFSGL